MSNRLVFDGLAELRQALRNLPSELTGEASNIVEATANAAAVEIRSEYGKHNVTGNLQAGVVISRVDKGKFSAGAIVKSSAPHAHLFEDGSQARHYTTAKGAKHATGKMWGKTPPRPVFRPVMIRHRRRMWELFKDLLTRKGLSVSGNG